MEAGALFHFGITAVRVLTTIVTKRWTAVVVEVLLLSVDECGANGNLWERTCVFGTPTRAYDMPEGPPNRALGRCSPAKKPKSPGQIAPGSSVVDQKISKVLNKSDFD